ncbi:CBS domain-containing protein [Colwelliaceae bacterium 6471]
MSVEKIMSRKVITLDIDDNLNSAKDIFDAHKIHHILITDNKALVGIVTDRDLYKHLSPAIGTRKETSHDTMLLQKKINLVMSKTPITSNKHISLNEAVLLFHDNHISCLPIVNELNQAIGVITWRDIIKILANNYRQKRTAPKQQ